MNQITTLERAPTRPKDDTAMLKAAANLTRDLNQPDARIYWADMIGCIRNPRGYAVWQVPVLRARKP